MSVFIEEHRDHFDVEPICRTLGVSASAITTAAGVSGSARGRRMSGSLEVIRVTHKKNYEAYGYRRTWQALLFAGERVPRCQVQRLMRQHGIQGGKPWAPPSPLRMPPGALSWCSASFMAQAPNRLWVGDMSYLRCWEGVVFFSFVIDVFSRRVVGWQLAGHMRTDLVLDALRMALGTRESGAGSGLLAHTDRGSQYMSGIYTQTLTDHGVLASAGSVGDAYDCESVGGHRCGLTLAYD